MPVPSLSLDASESELDGRYRWLQRLWMVGWGLLLAVTWRLWTPPTAFPAVPLVPPFSVPGVVEWGLAGGMVAALAGGLFARSARQVSLAMVAFAVIAVSHVLLNQHRLQPWFYQAILLSLLFASADCRRGLPLMRWLAIGVYFYSSIGKFDFQFLHTVGQQFLDAATGLIGMDASNWGERTRLWAAAMFPGVELAVAVGLLIRPTRSLAAWVGVVMHVTTIVLLSPLGLDHQPGVLVWNAAMVMQLVLLFGVPRMDLKTQQPAVAGPRSQLRILPAPVALAVVGLATVLPLLERVGYWDHWTSWALYSPHNSRVTVQVHASASGRLDPSILACMSEPDDEGWRTMDLDRWSIDAVGVPNYPQARFQLGVAIGLIQCQDLQRAARVHVQGVADRWSGQREHTVVAGPMQLDAAASRFWLNAVPRPCP